ncbi:uncharacterized protein LOC102706211 [Oryza brachyantha]|uniref:DUF506 family protein n=1 Tax=Oryza brachyantha TaxID=4533 RepID=J3MJ12_ORYBR|nr:uncharacterized protein LOC102706211 [Oryza brachyantha]
MPLQLRSQLQCGMETRPAPAPARASRFRRLLVRVSAGDAKEKEERAPEPEAGSVGLDRMVLSFMEDATTAVERPPRGGRCGNCFNGSGGDGSSDDEEFDFLPSDSAAAAAAAAGAASASASDALEALKGLVQSASVAERNLLADASRIAERCRKGGKKKADVRRAVADGLAALGYDAAVCKSRWDKTPSYPAGEHEYIDAVVATTTPTRLVVEVDFRSEFEVARSTKVYRAALQALPPLFAGTPDRLGQIVAVVAEAARQSLRKKGLHVPPWRKPEYMRAKWLSPQFLRCSDKPPPPPPSPPPTPVSLPSFSGEFELLLDGKSPPGHTAAAAAAAAGDDDNDVDGNKITVVVSPSPWRPVEPETASRKRPPPPHPKGKVVTGLAAVL